VYLPLARLQEALEQPDRANLVLYAGPAGTTELAAARASGSQHLADFEELHAQLAGHPDRKLMLFDPDSGQRVHAAIAVGDPDTAEHVSVTTPGLNTTVAASMGAMVSEATSLRREALRQLSRAGGRAEQQVAAIAWP
jgi:hypothetical protein